MVLQCLKRLLLRLRVGIEIVKEYSILKQGITNTLALPILYIYRLCSHCEHQNNPFQSKHFQTKETGSPNVKLVLIRLNFQKLDPLDQTKGLIDPPSLPSLHCIGRWSEGDPLQ